MNHRHCLDQLPFYVADQLAPAERAALDEHLAACAACRAALDDWHTVADEVRATAASRVQRFPALPAYHPLQEDLMTNPAMVYAPSLAALPKRRTKSRYSAITLAAALLVIVLFVGALVVLNDQHPDAQPGAVLLTVSLTPSPTDGGTPTPADQIATPTPAPLTVSPDGALPAFVRLEGIMYEQQGWNNQGPAALTMALSYYGWTHNEERAAKWLKPNAEDKNVSPGELVAFVNDETTGVYAQTGAQAIARLGGDLVLLKRLLAAGFPVVVEVSLQPQGEDWMGHYLLLMGYDEQQQQFLTYDSYLGSNNGQGRPSPYTIFDDRWQDFNRTLVVVYRPADESTLRDALQGYASPWYGYQRALDTARIEASQNSEDAFAWFNMGTAYTLLGDYDLAGVAYDEAFKIGLPWRMLWYQFGPYEAFFLAGRYTDVTALAEATLATTPFVEEAYYWRALASAAQGNTPAAAEDLALIMTYNAHFFAVQAFMRSASADPLAFGQATVAVAPITVEATPTLTMTVEAFEITMTHIVADATHTAAAATAEVISPTPNLNEFQLTATSIVGNVTATAAARLTPRASRTPAPGPSRTPAPSRTPSHFQLTSTAIVAAVTGTAAVAPPTLEPYQMTVTQIVVEATATAAAAIGVEVTPTPPPTVTATPDTTTLNNLKTDLVTIHGGTFMMGTTAEEAQTAMDECAAYGRTCTDVNLVSDSLPAHAVTLNSYQMEVYEVSLGQYVAFLNSIGPSGGSTGCEGQACIYPSEFSNILFDGSTYSVRNAELYNSYPATYVTWWGAAAYCKALGQRLPTEAEWEHAARGPEGYLYPWGNQFDAARAMSAYDIQPGAVPIYSYPNGTSPYGLFNMAGNVEEWVSDWYQPDYYSTQTADGAVANPPGPFSGTQRVLRGGGWDTYPLFLRSMHRMSADPGYGAASIGFRCAADGSSTATPAPDTDVFDDAGRVYVLLLGASAEPDTTGSYATGSLILLAMDSTAKTAAALTLPRDLWVDYPGLDRSGVLGDASRIGGEINYPGGGAMFAVKTVEKLTGITIPYYVRINQDALTTLFDAVGPLQVCPAESIHDDAYRDPVYGLMTVHFTAGCQFQDSVGLLQYVTVRHSDSDFARSARQLEVLLSARDQVFAPGHLAALVTQAPTLWSTLQGNMTTNLTLDELLALAYVANAIPRENIRAGQLTLEQIVSAVSPTGEAILVPNAPDVQQVIDKLFGTE